MMLRSRSRASRFLADTPPLPGPGFYSLSSFYREEFLRCQRCLDAHRGDYSERAINDVERALLRVMAQLDRLCAEDRADQVVSRVLRQFDLVTGRSAWVDSRQVN